tara:strand:- start:32 stop:196 length:165 start_codon:yes stop_codon:yes gene_type:complete
MNLQKDKRVNLRLPENLHEWLKIKAKESSISVTELINRVLIKYREEVDNEPKQF